MKLHRRTPLLAATILFFAAIVTGFQNFFPAKSDLMKGYIFNASLPPAPAGPIPNYTNVETVKMNNLFPSRATAESRLVLRGGGTELFSFALLRPEVFVQSGINKPFLYAIGEIDIPGNEGVNFNRIFGHADNEVSLGELKWPLPLGEIRNGFICSTQTVSSDYGPLSGPLYIWDENQSPKLCGTGHDCYVVTIGFTSFYGVTSQDILWTADAFVEIENPKSKDARILTAKMIDGTVSKSPAVVGTASYPGDVMLEPTVTGDGRLMIMHGGATGGLMYSMNTSSTPCRAAEWKTFKRVSEMKNDPSISHYGVSRYPFRTNEGREYQPGEVVSGSYPWIDQAGSNILFGTVSSPIATLLNSPNASIPKDKFVFDFSDNIDGQGDWFTARGGYKVMEKLAVQTGFGTLLDMLSEWIMRNGLSVAGLWTKGKIALLDGRLNPTLQTTTLFNVRVLGIPHFCNPPGQPPIPLIPHHLLATQCPIKLNDPDVSDCVRFQCEQYDLLYRGNRLFVQSFEGRKGLVPISGSAKTEVISPENTWNYISQMRSVSTFDVSWLVATNIPSSDYINFDNYLYHDALVISDMMVSADKTVPPPGEMTAPHFNHGLVCDLTFIPPHHRVCRNYSSTTHPRIQNVASSVELRDVHLVPPPFGVLHGGARVENAAVGGKNGRGIYLDGIDDYIQYDVACSADAIGSRQDWYAGIWINPKDVSSQRTLFSTSDGTAVVFSASAATKDQSISLRKNGSTAVFPLPPSLLLSPDRWTHVAFNVTQDPANGNTTHVEFYIDGYPLAIQDVESKIEFFQIKEGVIRIGADNSGIIANVSFKGWVDDFKIIRGRLLPSEICANAYGELVGDSLNSRQASQYPSSSHQFITQILSGRNPRARTYQRYFCEKYNPGIFDYASELAGKICVGKQTRDSRCINKLINFPEGPIYRELPRPYSLENQFCLRCHSDENKWPGLRATDALSQIATPFSFSHDSFDKRRQPTNPPQRVYGETGPYLRSKGITPHPRGALIDSLSFDASP